MRRGEAWPELEDGGNARGPASTAGARSAVFYKSVQTAAIWVFVVASAGMFIGSLGQLLVRIERHRVGEPPDG